MPESLVPRVGALLFSPLIGKWEKDALFGSMYPRDAKGPWSPFLENLRARVLAEGSPDLKVEALKTLSCPDAMRYLRDRDDEISAGAAVRILDREGSEGCDEATVKAAVAETKKRGVGRMSRVERYLAAAVVTCSVAGSTSEPPKSAATTAALARWFSAALRRAGASKKTHSASALAAELAEATMEARLEALSSTEQACSAVRRSGRLGF